MSINDEKSARCAIFNREYKTREKGGGITTIDYDIIINRFNIY